MFGLFKSKPAPDGPIIVSHSTIIDCPPDELYRIVDFADEMCWKKAVGSVEPTGEGTFLMKLDMAPELEFPVEVLETVPGASYSYECRIVPKVGRLVRSVERYDMSAENEGTLVTLTLLAEMDSGMTVKERKQESQMLDLAGHNALAKLKIHVENGVDTIRDIEAMQ